MGVRTRRWSARVAVIGAAAATIGMLAAPPASAAPANDAVGQALAIGSIPYTHTEWTGTATRATSDPIDCAGPRTVWFKYTATSEEALTASAGGGYVGYVAVYAGRPTRSSAALVCDYGGADFGTARGVTYYIAVSEGEAGTSTKLVFDLVHPPGIKAVVNKQGTVDVTEGVATVRITVTCSRKLLYLDLAISVVQRVSRTRLAPGTGSQYDLACSRTPRTYGLQVFPTQGVPFQRGAAAVTLEEAYGCDRLGSCTWEADEDPVTVRLS